MADEEQQEPDDLTMFAPAQPTPPPNEPPAMPVNVPPPAPYVPPPAPTPPPVAGQPYQPYGAPPPAPYGQVPGVAAFDASAPYGVDPLTGMPYSDKSKLVAGLLQILVPLGIGRFYMGHTGVGVAQLLVTIFTCGIGALWPFIDGILILTGNPRDGLGRPMKMS